METTRKVTPTVVKQNRFEFGDIGVLPNVHPYVRSVQPGGAAAAAGLKTGDIVLDVDGQPITFSYHLKEAIAKHPEQLITLTILRDGTQQKIQATPARNGQEGLLGIGIGDQTVRYEPDFAGAVKKSVKDNVKYAGLIFETLWG